MHCRKWRLGLQLCVDVWLFHGCLWLGDNFAGEVKKHNWTLVCPHCPSCVWFTVQYCYCVVTPGPGCLLLDVSAHPPGAALLPPDGRDARSEAGPPRHWHVTQCDESVTLSRHASNLLRPHCPTIRLISVNTTTLISTYIHFGAWHDTFSSFWKGRGIYSSQCQS